MKGQVYLALLQTTYDPGQKSDRHADEKDEELSRIEDNAGGRNKKARH